MSAIQIDFLLAGIRDLSGNPLNGGLVYTYSAGTTTDKATYTDKDKTSPATNPIVLDAYGQSQIYADGIYKVVVKTSAGTTLYTWDNVKFGVGGSWWSNVSDYASLSAAITAIGATSTELRLDAATTATAATVIPATMSVKGTKKGVITKSGSATITFNGPFEAGDYQVFSGFASTDITGLKVAKPQWWGAKQDSTTDCTTAIQSAIRAADRVEIWDDGSGNYYKVGTAIVFDHRTITGTHYDDSNKHVIGMGGGRPQIYNDTADGYAIFAITGESANKVTNITLENLNIRNGTSSATNYTSGKDGITATYAENITIKECTFPEIQGAYAIKHSYTKDFSVLKSTFTKWTYAAIASFVESENTLIQYNYFGTATTASYAQHYAVMSGSDQTGVGTFGVLNHKILDNVFSYDSSAGTSRWHAINSHGGAYIWVERNRILNYRAGINLAPDPDYLASGTLLKNVWVRDNVIDRGTATTNASIAANGILVEGIDWERDGNFLVEGNYIKAMGQASPASAGILGGYAHNIRVVRNKIENWDTVAIYLNKGWLGGEVVGNDIKNDYSVGTGYAIYDSVGGIYGVFVDWNKIWATDDDYIPAYGIYRDPTASTGNVIVGENNQIQATTITISSGHNHGFGAKPNLSYWKVGDKVYSGNTYGDGQELYVVKRPLIYPWVTSTAYLYGQFVRVSGIFYKCIVAHTSGVWADDLAANKWIRSHLSQSGGYWGYVISAQTCSGTSGEYTVTLTTAGNYFMFPPGAWVVITGGGPSAANLTTQVIYSNYSTGVLTLADPLGSDVATGAIGMAIPHFMGTGYLEGFTSPAWNPGSLGDGAGETSAAITVTGAELGDAVVVFPPYDLQDMTVTGYVQAANTVEIRIQNESGNTIDLAEATWYVKVYKK